MPQLLAARGSPRRPHQRLQPRHRVFRKRVRPPRLLFRQHNRAFACRDANPILKQRLFERDRTAADGGDAGTGIDPARPVHFRQIIDDDAGNYEGGSRLQEPHRGGEQKIDPAGFEQGGEHGVVDVPLPVSIAVAELVMGLEGVIFQQPACGFHGFLPLVRNISLTAAHSKPARGASVKRRDGIALA